MNPYSTIVELWIKCDIIMLYVYILLLLLLSDLGNAKVIVEAMLQSIQLPLY